MNTKYSKLLFAGFLTLAVGGVFAGCGDDKKTAAPPVVNQYSPLPPYLRTAVGTGEINFSKGSAAIDKTKIQQLLTDNMQLGGLGNAAFQFVAMMFGQQPAPKLNAKGGPLAKAAESRFASLSDWFLSQPPFQLGILPFWRGLGGISSARGAIAPKVQPGSCNSGAVTYDLPDELSAIIASGDASALTPAAADALARKAFLVKMNFDHCDVPDKDGGSLGVFHGGLSLGARISGDKASGITTLLNVTCDHFTASQGLATGRPLSCDGMLIAQITTTLHEPAVTYDMIFNASALAIKDGDDAYGVNGAVEAKFDGTLDPNGMQNLCTLISPLVNPPLTPDQCTQYASLYGGYVNLIGGLPVIDNMNFAVVVDATYSDGAGPHKLLEGIDVKVANKYQERFFAMYPGADKAQGYYTVAIHDSIGGGAINLEVQGNGAGLGINGTYPTVDPNLMDPTKMLDLMRALLKTSYEHITWSPSDQWYDLTL